MQTSEFFLPELPRSLPFGYHPKAAQIEFASNGWIREYLGDCFAGEEELLFFLRQRNGLYGPLTVPEADEGRARAIADWYQYVTVIDSFVSDRSALGASDGDARDLFARIMTAFTREPGENSGLNDIDDFAYGRAARDLWRRISPGLSPRQIERFTASLAAFLDGCAVEIRAKLSGDIPDYESCMAVREDSFGCAFLKLLTEYGAEVDMTGLAASGVLDEVHRHAMRQLIIVNDLLSWRKEHAQEDTMTTVRVLCDREGLALQDAVDRLCVLVEEHEKSYREARDRLLDEPVGNREDLVAYLRGLDHLVGGSQEFEYLTPRYFGDGSAWDGSTSGWLSLDDPVARFRKEKGAAR